MASAPARVLFEAARQSARKVRMQKPLVHVRRNSKGRMPQVRGDKKFLKFS